MFFQSEQVALSCICICTVYRMYQMHQRITVGIVTSLQCHHLILTRKIFIYNLFQFVRTVFTGIGILQDTCSRSLNSQLQNTTDCEFKRTVS